MNPTACWSRERTAANCFPGCLRKDCKIRGSFQTVNMWSGLHQVLVGGKNERAKLWIRYTLVRDATNTHMCRVWQQPTTTQVWCLLVEHWKVLPHFSLSSFCFIFRCIFFTNCSYVSLLINFPQIMTFISFFSFLFHRKRIKGDEIRLNETNCQLVPTVVNYFCLSHCHGFPRYHSLQPAHSLDTSDGKHIRHHSYLHSVWSWVNTPHL